MPVPWHTLMTAEDVDRISSEYVREHMVEGDYPTYNGLALALGTTLQTLRNYVNEIHGGSEADPAMIAAVKQALGKLDNVIERGMYTGKNPAGFLFALKNRGWTDQVQIEQRVSFTDLRCVFGDVLAGQIASNTPQVAVPSKANNIPDAVLIDSKPASE